MGGVPVGLRVRRDVHDVEHLLLFWRVAEENPVSRGPVVLCVGFEKILVVGALRPLILVGVQARMARISFEMTKRLFDGLAVCLEPGVRAQLRQLRSCRR